MRFHALALANPLQITFVRIAYLARTTYKRSAAKSKAIAELALVVAAVSAGTHGAE